VPDHDFEALSYVWGSQVNPVAIVLDGRDYYITQNLAAALQQLRMADQVRVLWIDAICIDQTDVLEKNIQVRSMQRVYSQATQVIGWLGVSDEVSDHVMDLIRDKDEEDYPQWPGGKDMLEDVSAIAKFLERDYWSRVWVLQEIALAEKVTWVCGSKTVETEDMESFLDKHYYAENLDRLTKALGFCGRASELGYFIKLFEQGPRSLRVGRLIDANQESRKTLIARVTKCTDVRDRVFGLYSLFEPNVQRHLIVDYSLDSTAVFINATQAMIDEKGRLDIVSWPKLPITSIIADKALQLPSWVPDWGSANHPLPFAYWFEPTRRNSADFGFLPGGKLRCKGAHVGSITHIQRSTALQSGGDGPSRPVDLCAFWVDIITFCRGIARNNETSVADLATKFLNTLSAFVPHPQRVKNDLVDWIQSNEQDPWPPQPQGIHLPQETLAWLSEIRGMHFHRLFFEVKDFFDSSLGGHLMTSMIGLASTAIREADLVCVFPGCCVPLILRPANEGEHHIVSDAYSLDIIGSNQTLEEGFELSTIYLDQDEPMNVDDLKDFYII
jgi:hypothetical protein